MSRLKGEMVRDAAYLTPQAKTEILQALTFLENFEDELDGLGRDLCSEPLHQNVGLPGEKTS